MTQSPFSSLVQHMVHGCLAIKGGWIHFKKGWNLPNPPRYLESKARMTEDVCLLKPEARKVVETQIAETCDYRGWTLFAANCRSNHMHIVVGAVDTPPKKFRVDLKAWCTRRLKERIDPNRKNWWAERGSIRWVFDEESLEKAMTYVMESQDRMDRKQS